MALIKCSECGREISDKAVACPGCGCPVNEISSNNQSETFNLISELHKQYPNERVKAIKILREKTGYDLKTAKDLIDKEFLGMTQNEKDTLNKYTRRAKKQEINEQMQSNLNAIANMGYMLSGKGKTARCPRCHSTSISYDTKKLSIGRAIVGDAIAGAPGAVLGGLSSKKGYGVCLNCGKRWKI